MCSRHCSDVVPGKRSIQCEKRGRKNGSRSSAIYTLVEPADFDSSCAWISEAVTRTAIADWYCFPECFNMTDTIQGQLTYFAASGNMLDSWPTTIQICCCLGDQCHKAPNLKVGCNFQCRFYCRCSQKQIWVFTQQDKYPISRPQGRILVRYLFPLYFFVSTISLSTLYQSNSKRQHTLTNDWSLCKWIHHLKPLALQKANDENK